MRSAGLSRRQPPRRPAPPAPGRPDKGLYVSYALRRALGALVLAAMLMARPAEGSVLCTWLGRCLYESPGFQITVVDRDTGQPLADVHAMAEWQGYVGGRPNGPLMVQDATSGGDGRLTFPAWGPLPGPPEGLILNSDPVITLFKMGYRPLVLRNPFPVGAEETDRIRAFRQDGKTFEQEPFRGSLAEHLEQLARVARGVAGPRRDEQTRRFRRPYLDRLRRVLAELRTLPEDRAVADLLWSVERSVSSLEAAP